MYKFFKTIQDWMCKVGLHQWRYFDPDFAMKKDLGHITGFYYCAHCDKTTKM